MLVGVGTAARPRRGLPALSAGRTLQQDRRVARLLAGIQPHVRDILVGDRLLRMQLGRPRAASRRNRASPTPSSVHPEHERCEGSRSLHIGLGGLYYASWERSKLASGAEG